MIAVTTANPAESSLDFILNTIPKAHDPNPYIELLAHDGVMCIVGCLEPLAKPIDMTKMLMDRRTLATSLIGGIAETQEVLDFCAKHEIWPDVRLIDVKEVNDAFDHLDKGDVDYRYVIRFFQAVGDPAFGEVPGGPTCLMVFLARLNTHKKIVAHAKAEARPSSDHTDRRHRIFVVKPSKDLIVIRQADGHLIQFG